MWKRILGVAAAVLTLCGPSNASLIDRGGGLIYDSVLNVTWLQDANYAYTSGAAPSSGQMTWTQAKSWAANLVYYDSVRNRYWDDWRLPRNLPVNGLAYNFDWSNDGSTDLGLNIGAKDSAYPYNTASEMSYMHYVNLGNPSAIGHSTGGAGVRENVGPFINLLDDFYWFGTDVQPVPNFPFLFNFHYGYQDFRSEASTIYAWAVREGDVAAVPIPAPVWLLGTGLVGVVGVRRIFRKTENEMEGETYGTV